MQEQQTKETFVETPTQNEVNLDKSKNTMFAW